MTGEYGKVYKRAWGDPDFKALTAAQQLQYLKLVSQPDVSMAGVLTHAVHRWAGQTSDLDPEAVEAALVGLERARFIAYDRETQEVLIRSYIRNDGGWKSPLTMKAIRGAVERILSPKLRCVIAAELERIDTSGLSEKVSERYSGTVREYVEGVMRGLMKGYPAGPGHPSEGVCQGVSHTLSEGVYQGVSEGGHGFAPIATAPATAPATATAAALAPASRGAVSDETSRDAADGTALVPLAPADAVAPKAKRGTRLSEDWQPERTPGNIAAEEGRSRDWLCDQLELFRNYWLAKTGKDAVKLDWNRTWQTWIRRADEFAPQRRRQPMTGATMTDDDWQRLARSVTTEESA